MRKKRERLIHSLLILLFCSASSLAVVGGAVRPSDCRALLSLTGVDFRVRDAFTRLRTAISRSGLAHILEPPKSEMTPQEFLAYAKRWLAEASKEGHDEFTRAIALEIEDFEKLLPNATHSSTWGSAHADRNVQSTVGIILFRLKQLGTEDPSLADKGISADAIDTILAIGDLASRRTNDEILKEKLKELRQLTNH